MKQTRAPQQRPMRPGFEQQVREFIRSIGQSDPDQHTRLLLMRDGYADRFQYMARFLDGAHRSLLLVSGAAAGTELHVAREFGFHRVLGTEVDPGWARLASLSVQDLPDCCVLLYDGERLPLPDSSVHAIASGHIIEHTSGPRSYFLEHVRVLAEGGVFFLEFPDRFHPIELHTTLPGFEWAPPRLREFLYSRISECHRPSSPSLANLYASILRDLRPVGLPDIFRFASEWPEGHCRVEHFYRPLPGYVRMILRKGGGNAPTPPPPAARTAVPPSDSLPAPFPSPEPQAAAGALPQCIAVLESALEAALHLFRAMAVAGPPSLPGGADTQNTFHAASPPDGDLCLAALGRWTEAALSSLAGPGWAACLSQDPWRQQMDRLLLHYEREITRHFGGRLASPPSPAPASGQRPSQPAPPPSLPRRLARRLFARHP
ncbi:MAG: methyltransferase domain-containing protein [Arcobacter sp.]|nr:class I SAM-dependent methyltransferase [Bryobacteraceae bacterium]MDW8434532.1 methyltransferase domain-containing protein [Arcobacter sp.]